MNAKTEELIDWLRDAYAMEKSMEQMLQRMANDEDLLLPLRNFARTHLEETQRHAEGVERSLELLGAEAPTFKTGAAAIGEFFKDAMTSFASDKKIKDLLTGYAGEHFEIACYTAIRAAAENIGQGTIAAICDTILEDEHRAAEALLASLPQAVDSYLVAAE